VNVLNRRDEWPWLVSQKVPRYPLVPAIAR
jgi:hypothetical protein